MRFLFTPGLWAPLLTSLAQFLAAPATAGPGPRYTDTFTFSNGNQIRYEAGVRRNGMTVNRLVFVRRGERSGWKSLLPGDLGAREEILQVGSHSEYGTTILQRYRPGFFPFGRQDQRRPTGLLSFIVDRDLERVLIGTPKGLELVDEAGDRLAIPWNTRKYPLHISHRYFAREGILLLNVGLENSSEPHKTGKTIAVRLSDGRSHEVADATTDLLRYRMQHGKLLSDDEATRPVKLASFELEGELEADSGSLASHLEQEADNAADEAPRQAWEADPEAWKQESVPGEGAVRSPRNRVAQAESSGFSPIPGEAAAPGKKITPFNPLPPSQDTGRPAKSGFVLPFVTCDQKQAERLLRLLHFTPSRN